MRVFERLAELGHALRVDENHWENRGKPYYWIRKGQGTAANKGQGTAAIVDLNSSTGNIDVAYVIDQPYFILWPREQKSGFLITKLKSIIGGNRKDYLQQKSYFEGVKQAEFWYNFIEKKPPKELLKLMKPHQIKEEHYLLPSVDGVFLSDIPEVLQGVDRWWESFFHSRDDGKTATENNTCVITGEKTWCLTKQFKTVGRASLVSYNLSKKKCFVSFDQKKIPISNQLSFDHKLALFFLEEERMCKSICDNRKLYVWASDRSVNSILNTWDQVQNWEKQVLSQRTHGQVNPVQGQHYTLILDSSHDGTCYVAHFRENGLQNTYESMKEVLDITRSPMIKLFRIFDVSDKKITDAKKYLHTLLREDLVRVIYCGENFSRTLLQKVVQLMWTPFLRSESSGQYPRLGKELPKMIESIHLIYMRRRGLDPTQIWSYDLGQAFAVVCHGQAKAIDSNVRLETKMAKLFYSSPQRAFVTLQTKWRSYYNKIRRDHPGLAVILSQIYDQAMGSFQVSAPPKRVMTLEEQVAFECGYNEGTRKVFVKKEKEVVSE